MRLIDADKIIFREIDEIGGEYEPYLGCSKSQIDSLPSVTPQEPQSFKWCKTCKEYDQEKHCCHRFSKVIRESLNEHTDAVLEDIKAEIDKISFFDTNGIGLRNKTPAEIKNEIKAIIDGHINRKE